MKYKLSLDFIRLVTHSSYSRPKTWSLPRFCFLIVAREAGWLMNYRSNFYISQARYRGKVPHKYPRYTYY